MRPQGALLIKLCTREFSHAPSIYVAIKTSLKKRAHTGCTPPKIVHPAAKMISLPILVIFSFMNIRIKSFAAGYLVHNPQKDSDCSLNPCPKINSYSEK